MSQDSPTLMIIDGHAMAYRAHYALANQEMLNADGMPTETIYGFFRMLAKLIGDYKPQYFCIAFDPAGKTFRHDVYTHYKENRSATPEPLKIQMDEIIEISAKLGLAVKRVEKMEADDVIASLIHRLEKLGASHETKKQKGKIHNVIVSGDKDLFSLMSESTTMLRPKKGVSEFIEINEEWVENELGVSCDRVRDYMALTGDSSDNVPGVKGIGPKSASALIRDFGDLDGIYANLENISSASTRKKLEENRELAFLSKELVTLKTDISVLDDPETLKVDYSQGLGKTVEIFRERGYPTLFAQWIALTGGQQTENQKESGTHAPEKAKAAKNKADDLKNVSGALVDEDTSLNAPLQNIKINARMQIIRTKEEWDKAEKEILAATEVAVDTETTGLRPMQADLVGVSMAWVSKNEYHSLYLPVVFDSEHERHFDYLSLPDGPEALTWVKPLLENPKVVKIGQNIKYDYLVLLSHGVQMQNIQYDTMVLSFLTDPNDRRHGLDDLCLKHLDHVTIKYKELAGVGKKALPLVALPLDKVAEYAAEDAETTARLKPLLLEKVQSAGLEKLYREIDLPLIFLLARMEQNGVCLDSGYIQTLEKKYAERLEKVRERIYKQAGHEFNINSTKEMQQVLFTELGILSKKKTGKGALSTEASVLESIRDQHPIIHEILEYRKVAKLMSGYIEPLTGYINPRTGRIHTSFSQTIAATGRLASSDPNLQNIPIKGEDGKALRRAFVAAPGCELLSLDYSQIELRILAHYSGDEHLMRAYRDDEDIHDQAAYLMFRRRFDSENGTWLTEEQEGTFREPAFTVMNEEILQAMKATPEFSDLRSRAKVLNFSIAYGVTEYGLSKNLKISQKEAAQYIDLYFQNFPGIKKYMEKQIELVRETGVSENFFGRKRLLPQIGSSNRFHREAAERLAINTPIQSTAADLIKLAMLEIQSELDKRKLKSRMLLQIHDELLFETPVEEKEEMYQLAKDKMENVVKFHVPLKVSGGFGVNWEEAK